MGLQTNASFSLGIIVVQRISHFSLKNCSAIKRPIHWLCSSNHNNRAVLQLSCVGTMLLVFQALLLFMRLYDIYLSLRCLQNASKMSWSVVMKLLGETVFQGIVDNERMG